MVPAPLTVAGSSLDPDPEKIRAGAGSIVNKVPKSGSGPGTRGGSITALVLSIVQLSDMSDPIPSTSEGGAAAAVDPTEEDWDKLIMENEPGSDTGEYDEPDEDTMVDKSNEGEQDLGGWNDPEAIANFDKEYKQKKKKVDEEQKAEYAMEDAREEAETAKLEAKKIRYVAPGLDLFTEKFLANFSAKDLNLERDFLYTQKRGRLRDLGIDDDSISQVMGKD